MAPPEMLLNGSIPAHAGEPAGSASRNTKKWVYPRACGGTQAVHAIEDMAVGSIPAHAGEPR